MTDQELLHAATLNVARQESLVAITDEALAAMKLLCEKGAVDVSDGLKGINTLLADMLQTRCAISRETANILKSLCELNHGFTGSRFKDTLTHLKEFVELCERLKALKESGFLDSVFKAVPPEGKP